MKTFFTNFRTNTIGPRPVATILGDFTRLRDELTDTASHHYQRAEILRSQAASAATEADRAAAVADRIGKLIA
jgi:hypothetical protein